MSASRTPPPEEEILVPQKKSGCTNAIPAATKKLKLSTANLQSKEGSLDSTSVSAMCEQRKEIAVPPKKRKYFRSVSSSLSLENPIDGSPAKENESKEEDVGLGTVSGSATVSVAGPSGLQAQPRRRNRRGRFVCDVKTCGMNFSCRRDLENHQRTHTGEKPFLCDICNRGFSQKAHLKNHQVKHTGEKNFECPICHKTFGRNNVLKNHLLTHSDEKPFVCSICGTGFLQNGNLKRHLLTHSDGKNL